MKRVLLKNKGILLIPIIFLSLKIFPSCSLFIHSDPKNEKSEPEQTLEDFPVSLSKHYFWRENENECSYNNVIKILKINKAWKGIVISAKNFSGNETFDASNYRYLKNNHLDRQRRTN